MYYIYIYIYTHMVLRAPVLAQICLQADVRLVVPCYADTPTYTLLQG